MVARNNWTTADSFLVGFEGRLIECASLDDAIAIKSARQALAEDTECDATTAEFERLVRVLRRHDLHDAAGQLLQLSVKKRALKLLAASFNYTRPRRRPES
jgi:hypothetical protein